MPAKLTAACSWGVDGAAAPQGANEDEVRARCASPSGARRGDRQQSSVSHGVWRQQQYFDFARRGRLEFGRVLELEFLVRKFEFLLIEFEFLLIEFELPGRTAGDVHRCELRTEQRG